MVSVACIHHSESRSRRELLTESRSYIMRVRIIHSLGSKSQILTFVLFALLPCSPGVAGAVLSSGTPIQHGSVMQVPILISQVDNLLALEVGVYCDPHILTAFDPPPLTASVVARSLLSSGGVSEMPSPRGTLSGYAGLDAPPGNLTRVFGYPLSPAQTSGGGVHGDGTLAMLNFEILAFGASPPPFLDPVGGQVGASLIDAAGMPAELDSVTDGSAAAEPVPGTLWTLTSGIVGCALLVFRRIRKVPAAVLLCVLIGALPAGAQTAGRWVLVGWNDLGMHCMNGIDYSTAVILPPYNTIHAQLIDPSGRLVTTAAGITVTYQATPDSSGSINKSSIGKTNFWDYVNTLFGTSPSLDVGLAGYSMPGLANQPRPMSFEPSLTWFTATGIPITPFDDNGVKNYYPMMRLIARDQSNNVLATADIVLPVSDEMSCQNCHASGSFPDAQPTPNWVNDSNPIRDYKLNFLLLHDNHRFLGDMAPPSPQDIAFYRSVLKLAGFSEAGLYATATSPNPPSILCARCHASNALSLSGISGVSSLTTAVHTHHADVVVDGVSMDAANNRSACYQCHPGSTTRCLRGVMGNAVAPDGSMAIQCQNCHGSMLAVANPNRQGWLNVPKCQSCHTGTAVSNSGAIRYTSVFDNSGSERNAASQVFATKVDVPSRGLSMYRFSTDHGGLQCEACHGPTHAETPSSHVNDNVQANGLQGHAGELAECSVCHPSNQTLAAASGPHGLHPIGDAWALDHHTIAKLGTAPCRDCHGTDYKGTVLARAKNARFVVTKFGARQLWKGFQVTCYTCHNGPNDMRPTSNRAPIAFNATLVMPSPHRAPIGSNAAVVTSGVSVSIVLRAMDPDGSPVNLRIVAQPRNGTVALSAATATYYPNPGFHGVDSFNFAASDGLTDSNLATVALRVN